MDRFTAVVSLQKELNRAPLEHATWTCQIVSYVLAVIAHDSIPVAASQFHRTL
jgi:hypothetical protein